MNHHDEVERIEDTNGYRVKHSMIDHKLAIMHRDPRGDEKTGCSTDKFRQLVKEITLILGVAATRSLNTRGMKPVVIPILRNGLGMTDAMLEILPAARVGHLGIQRAPGEIIEYLVSLPTLTKKDKDGSIIDQRKCFILDPIIGTGSVSYLAIQRLKSFEMKPENITFICIVATLEGLKRLKDTGVKVYFAEESELVDGVVTPSWGDDGEMLYGVR